MGITYRHMRKDERKAVRTLARSCFSPFNALLIEKPDHAIVAVDGDTIVGGGTYRIIRVRQEVIGYLSWGFVARSHRAQQIGGHIYAAVTNHLFEIGVDEVCAIVSNDNTASWSLFQRLGYHRRSFADTVRSYSLWGALKLWLLSVALFAMGSSFWITQSRRAHRIRKYMVPYDYLLLLFANLLLISAQGLLFSLPLAYRVYQAGALVSLVTAMMIIQYAVISREVKPIFSLWHGGAAVPLIVGALGGLFPFMGSVYPDKETWDYREYKKILGIAAACSWSLVLCAAALAYGITKAAGGSLYLMYIQSYAVVFLICDVATGIFEPFDGSRVRRWSKTAYGLFSLGSLALVILMIFF